MSTCSLPGRHACGLEASVSIFNEVKIVEYIFEINMGKYAYVMQNMR